MTSSYNLESKVKVNADVRRVSKLLDADLNTINSFGVSEPHIIKIVANVAYSTLINFTAPVSRKISALHLLKHLFQTAHPLVIQQCARVVPVLADTSKNGSNPGNYMIVREERSFLNAEMSEKYVRFSMEILKQWAEYMEDCSEIDSVYFSKYTQISKKKAVFPQYFLYFTMADYVQFMLNWMRRKKRNHVFADKIQTYHFLTNEQFYKNKYAIYKIRIAEYAEVLIEEIISILINHTIPVPCKFQTLKAMRDLYQQANLFFCQKADELFPPFFNYTVGLFLKSDLKIDKYFQKVQKRLGAESQQSKQYILTILQIIKHWNRCNVNSVTNPYAQLTSLIDRKNLLGSIEKPLFNNQDISSFNQNKALGKHRQPEYVIPAPKDTSKEPQLKYAEQLRRYEKFVSEQKKKQQDYQNELKDLRAKVQSQTVQETKQKEANQKLQSQLRNAFIKTDQLQRELQNLRIANIKLIKDSQIKPVADKPQSTKLIPTPQPETFKIVINDRDSEQLKSRLQTPLPVQPLHESSKTKLNTTMKATNKALLSRVQSDKNFLRMSDMIKLKEQHRLQYH